MYKETAQCQICFLAHPNVYLPVMDLTHILFDLDDTLYPQELGLMREIGRRIHLWLQKNLALSEKEAIALRNVYIERHGTTLGGLVTERRQIDVDDYLAFVHDVPVEQWVRPNPALAEMLAAIPLRQVVFTNSDRPHAGRVLRALGAAEQFEQIVGICELELVNKPLPGAYQRVLQLLDVAGPACIFVDDRAVNLWPARELGITTILVGVAPDEAPPGVDFVVGDVLEVGPLIRRLIR